MGDEFIARLESEGRDIVSQKLSQGVYGSKGLNYTTVVNWLGLKDRARNDSSQTEQAEIAREASTAAKRAAKAAERAASAAEEQAGAARRQADAAESANTRATIALVIAIISIIVTAIGIYASP